MQVYTAMEVEESSSDGDMVAVDFKATTSGALHNTIIIWDLLCIYIGAKPFSSTPKRKCMHLCI